jgi:hypothetical protein
MMWLCEILKKMNNKFYGREFMRKSDGLAFLALMMCLLFPVNLLACPSPGEPFYGQDGNCSRKIKKYGRNHIS